MRWREFAVLLFVYLLSLCFKFRFWLFIALLSILIFLVMVLRQPSCTWGFYLLLPFGLCLEVADVDVTSQQFGILPFPQPSHACYYVKRMHIVKNSQIFNLQWWKKLFLKPSTNLFDIWKKSRPRVWFVQVSLLCLKSKTTHLKITISTFYFLHLWKWFWFSLS